MLEKSNPNSKYNRRDEEEVEEIVLSDDSDEDAGKKYQWLYEDDLAKVMIGKNIFTKIKAITHFKKDNKLNTKPLFKPRKAKKNIKNTNK